MPDVPATTQTSNAERDVPARRMSFDEALTDVPRHFTADGDLIQSHLVATLSSMFPDGEDFFVESVRNFRDRITDPELKRQVNGFIGQESMHGRVHRAFNARLAELGYPTKLYEARTRFILKQQKRVMSEERQLADTAALEHFTAVLAELALRSPEMREAFGHPAVRDILLWHALEESEHKAVAFDVYKAIGGSEEVRVKAMRGIRIGFVIGTTVQVGISMLLDPKTYRPGALRKSIRRLQNSPIWDRRLWDQLCDYDRPDFHPDDSDTDELVKTWRAALFGDDGSLNKHLAGVA